MVYDECPKPSIYRRAHNIIRIFKNVVVFLFATQRNISNLFHFHCTPRPLNRCCLSWFCISLLVHPSKMIKLAIIFTLALTTAVNAQSYLSNSRFKVQPSNTNGQQQNQVVAPAQQTANRLSFGGSQGGPNKAPFPIVHGVSGGQGFIPNGQVFQGFPHQNRFNGLRRSRF